MQSKTIQVGEALEKDIKDGEALCSFIGGPLDKQKNPISISAITMKAYVHEEGNKKHHYNIRRWVWEHTEIEEHEDKWKIKHKKINRKLIPTTIAVHSSIQSPFEELLNSYINK